MIDRGIYQGGEKFILFNEGFVDAEAATGLEAESEFVCADKGQAEGQSENAAGFQGRHSFVGGITHVFFAS